MTTPEQQALQIAAQAWCEPATSGREMDVTLATVIAEKFAPIIAERDALKPIPHVHRDLMIQYANDPSQKVWRQRQDGTWQRMLSVLWRYYEKYHIGEEPPKPEPQMITIEGHTFAAPSPVATETHTCRVGTGRWVRPQDLDAYWAAKDALMDRAIKEQLK